MTEFEGYVAQWDTLCGDIKDAKRALKKLTDREMAMRKHITEQCLRALGDEAKHEGVNKYEMPDGRVIKITTGITRKVDALHIEAARQAYAQANDRPAGVAFDDLLRVKYELAVAPLRKLEGQALSAATRMFTSTPTSPKVELD